MDDIKLPTIVRVIGDNFRAYTGALAEAQNLAGRDELDADERRRFGELIQYLKGDNATAGLLASEQRVGLDAVLETHAQLIIPVSASIGGITEDYILFRDIAPVDADGNVLWRHDELYVMKNIVRDESGGQVSNTPHAWVGHFEQQEKGLFLPSPADSCNLLDLAFANKSDAEIGRFLMQFRDKGNGYGWHAQNGIVDFGAGQVIHYPTASDFNQSGSINAGRRRTALDFDKSILEDEKLEDALHDPAKERYAKQWSCLRDPWVLVEIGKEYGKPAKLWFPWSGKGGAKYDGKGAVWLGCYFDYFVLSAYDVLSGNDAARGVFLGAAGAPTQK